MGSEVIEHTHFFLGIQLISQWESECWPNRLDHTETQMKIGAIVWIYKHAGLQVSKALKMNGISVLMGGLRGGPPPL